MWASREESRAVTTQEEAISGMTEEQRRLLAAAHGLDPDTAQESDIMAAAQAAADARATGSGDDNPTPTPTPAPAPEPVAASSAPCRMARS
jgi:hypothetical protein